MEIKLYPGKLRFGRPHSEVSQVVESGGVNGFSPNV